MTLVGVVAIARNGCIGKDGGLPWRIPEDLRHFKRTTVGHAIVMGRATYESIGKPLPDRTNIVVSRTLGPREGVVVAKTLEEALEQAYARDDAPCVIGGAQIYRATMPLLTRIELTEIDRDVDGDTFLEIDRAAWREVSRAKGETPNVWFVVLERT